MNAGERRTSGARTFTEALRAAGEQFLVELLRRRPDLRQPLPVDLTELAARATTASSVARASDALNVWQRQILLALAALPDPTDLATVSSLVGGSPISTELAVADLRALGLVWGSDDGLHLVRTAREQFGSYPAGLAPNSPRPLGDAEIDQLLGECEPAAREVLDRLVWAPAGSVAGADRPVTLATARSPVERLLARRLLRPIDRDHVLLPREVSWKLRGGALTPDPVSAGSPVVVSHPRRPRLVDNGAAGAALDLLHDLDLVVRVVEGGSLKLLRTGGVGQRELGGLAQALGTDTAHAAFLLEAAAAAGFVVADGPMLAVTTAYDRWHSDDGLSRWRQIGSAWNMASRSWIPTDGGHALGSEGELSRLAELRRLVARLAAAAGPDSAPDLDSLRSAAVWHRPSLRRIGPLSIDEAVAMVWRELGWLGAVSLGAGSSLLPLLVDPTAEVSAKLSDLFPEPVDHIVIQGDLTAVATGPLAHGPARDLRLLADQESRGAGGVFRFTAGSLRRAFDAGWSAIDVRTWLENRSTTGLPQPLDYLIDDVARRYGSIRVGTAGSYLTISDETQASALLAHPDATSLGLRQVAPGVLVCFADPEDVVAWLRRAGHSPTAEDAHGRTLTSPGPHRVRSDRHRASTSDPTPEQVAATILAGSQRISGNGQSTAETLLLLTKATRAAQPIQIAYVATDGTLVDRVLSPLDLDGGLLRAVDTDAAQVVNIPLSRISNIQPIGNGRLD